MAAYRMSLVLIDDVTPDGSSRMNCEVSKTIWSGNLQKHASKTNWEQASSCTGNTTKDLINGESARSEKNKYSMHLS